MKEKSEKRNNRSCHHIVGHKNNDNFNVDLKENKIIISQQLHDAFNIVFGINQCPKSQLNRMIEIWDKTLSKETKRELMNILSKPDRQFYIRKLVK